MLESLLNTLEFYADATPEMRAADNGARATNLRRLMAMEDTDLLSLTVESFASVVSTMRQGGLPVDKLEELAGMWDD